MKKNLALITMAMLLTFVAGTASADQPNQQANVTVTAEDAHGNFVALDLAGSMDVLIGFGDPDDGITGNRGNAAPPVTSEAGDVSLPATILMLLNQLALQGQIIWIQ